MGILGSILAKVFGDDHPAVQGGGAPTAPVDTSAAPPTTSAEEAAQKTNTWQDAPTNKNAGIPQSQHIDIEATLDAMKAKRGEDLDWRTSVVDLMKVLGLESSHAERNALADELHYTGDKQDSATMNRWLHKELMKKFSDNGGTLPADLR